MRHHDAQGTVVQVGQGVVALVACMALVAIMEPVGVVGDIPIRLLCMRPHMILP